MIKLVKDLKHLHTATQAVFFFIAMGVSLGTMIYKSDAMDKQLVEIKTRINGDKTEAEGNYTKVHNLICQLAIDINAKNAKKACLRE